MSGIDFTPAVSEEKRRQMTDFLNQRFTRRQLIQYGGLAGMSVSALWALACQQAAPAATLTKAPAEATPAAATPTKAPASTAAPAGTPTLEKIGSQLIGKLEGPTIITDPAKYPKAFKEAPELADLVKAGKLPAVRERIGEDPLIVKPLREIGKHGGSWRRGFTGPGDKWNGYRAASGTDHILFWEYTGQNVVPNMAKGWELSDGGRTTTLFLRRGMKWSDGQAFTADDFIFWWEDVYQNKDLVPTSTFWMTISGKPGVMEKVDTYSVRFKFPDPYYLFPDVLAGCNEIGGGHSANGLSGMGGYAPAHYLKQFHPKYVSKEELDRKVKEAKFDNWVSLFKFKNDWALNLELPALTPWKTTSPINTPSWTLERNPYSIWVDAEGNQLPYIDKVVLTLAENLEVLNLRAIAGEYDMQERHIDLAKLPVFLSNQGKGGYKVYLDPGEFTDTILKVNLSYEADPEIAKWLTNADFRRALSLGINRDQLNETFWLGTGTPTAAVPGETNKYNPGPEYRTLWATYDPKKANEMLDKIGLDKKDAEGYRLRTDGKGRLRVEIMTFSAQMVQFTQIAEMIKQQLKEIGVYIDVVEVERSLGFKRNETNETQLWAWANDGMEHMFTRPVHVIPFTPMELPPLYALWLQTAGQKGKTPPPRLREQMEKWQKAFGVPPDESIKLGKEVWKISAEEVYMIGVVGLGAAYGGTRIAKVDLGNVPARIFNSPDGKNPSISLPVTYFWKK